MGLTELTPNQRYYQQNKSRYKAYYEANKEKKISQSRNAKLVRLFGITSGDYEALKVSQNFQCAICNNSLQPGRRTHIDHCHSTNKVRGLLCENCNRGLGMFKDDVNRLSRAIGYFGANQ